MIVQARGGDGPNLLRMPPADRQAELALIGSCAADNFQIDAVVQLGLKADDFYDSRCGDAFAAFLRLRAAGRPADYRTLFDELKALGSRWATEAGLPSEGFNDLCTDAAEAYGAASSAPEYAAIVRDKAAKRRLIELAEGLLHAAYEDREPAAPLLERAEQAVFALGDARLATSTARMADAIDEVVARLERRKAGEFAGVTTGFQRLDEILDGLHAGGLYLVAARPSIGKSAFALNVAEHAAVEQEKPVLYVSLEMRRVDLAERFLASRGRLDGQALRTGQLGRDDYGSISRLRHEADSYHFEIDDSHDQTLPRIAATARRLRARSGLGLLVVDYVGLVDAEAERGESRQESSARLSRRLKVLAGELDAPVLALVQLNRQPEGRADKKPQLADLRESGAWEQDADAVILLHRPEFYDPSDRPGQADLMLVKHRMGPTGIVAVRYERCFVRFSEGEPSYDQYGNEA